MISKSRERHQKLTLRKVQIPAVIDTLDSKKSETSQSEERKLTIKFVGKREGSICRKATQK